MKLIIALMAAITLTGCASTCTQSCLFGVFGPGNPAFDRIALAHDRADPCQTGLDDEARRKELGRPEGYQRPDWCFAGKKKQAWDLYDRSGHRIGTIRAK